MNELNMVDEYHKPTGNDSVLKEEELHEQFPTGISNGAILTYSGQYFDPLKPDPRAIRIIDIAHSLGNSCRYGGHCPRFYSVAEHSLLVERLMREAKRSPIECFGGLMHDSEEAYLPDLPTPIKRNFPSFIEAGINLRKVIWDLFEIPNDIYPLIKDFDQEAYLYERNRLWDKRTWHTFKPLEAKHRFLEKFRLYASVLGKTAEAQINDAFQTDRVA